MRVNPRPNAKFLKLKDADAEFGIPKATLWILVTDKKLPSIKFGRSIYIRRTDLEALLEELTVRP